MFDDTGADSLSGGLGADTIDGGAGNDSLSGGAEGDTFRFTDGFGTDTVDGGEAGDDLDTLDFSQMSAGMNVVFSGDEGGDGWSPVTTGDTDPYFGSILGRVQGTASATDIELSRTIDLDNTFNDAVIEFDFHRIDSWDDEALQIHANGHQIFTQTFNSGTIVGGSNTVTVGGVTYTVTLTSLGDAAQNGHWSGESWTPDQSFRVRIEVENAPDTLELGFGSTVDQAFTDESSALDNFAVVSTNDTTIDPTAFSNAGSANNDTISGGAGNDLILDEEGAGVLAGDAGNDATLDGEGADSIVAGSGDLVDGGEGGDDNDTLYLGDLGAVITYDSGNPENGSVLFSDGTTMNFSNIETVIPCFTPGSRVETERGTFKVEDLRAGDMIRTRDNGPQEIRWVGRKVLGQVDLARAPDLRPILIRKGALGPGVPNRDMQVSPQHRMLVEGVQAELLFGPAQVLVRAKHLTHLAGIEVVSACERVTYVHLMCDAHEIIRVDDAWTESFQPGDMLQLDEAQEIFEDLLCEFPHLATEAGRANHHSARFSLKAHEAALLALA